MKLSTHQYAQFPSNRYSKVLWHVLQRSTQSNEWSPSEHSVKYNTVHIMNVIENIERKKKKRERTKQEDKEQYEPITLNWVRI